MHKHIHWAWNQRVVRYLIIGSWNTFFSIVLLAISHQMLHKYLGTAEVFTISWLITLLQSYLTQKKFVWKTNTEVHRELPKFFIVSGANYVANLGLIVLLVDHLKYELLVSQLAIVAFLTLINYTVLRIWTFKEKSESEAS